MLFHLAKSTKLHHFCDRYDFVLHANKGQGSSECQGSCGEKNEAHVRYMSEGIFRMRFTGYMVCSVYKVHQEALLIYNKRKETKNQIVVPRSESASKLAVLKALSTEHKTFLEDKRNKKMLPMINPPNYAPHSGSSYKVDGFVPLSDLSSCFGPGCKDESGRLFCWHLPISTNLY